MRAPGSGPGGVAGAPPHRFAVRVFYEDTDMGGVVYHANFLRFAERARSDWARGLGIDQGAMREAGVVFAVRRVEADYLLPARFDDELVVLTVPESATGARAVLRQEVRRGGQLLFAARVTVAAMGADGRPRRLPEAMRAALRLPSAG